MGKLPLLFNFLMLIRGQVSDAQGQNEDVVLITGGYAGGGARLWRSELLGTELVSKCYVPVLHQKRHGHVTFTTNDNPVAVVSCGGFGEGMMGRSCIGLNTKTQEWETMADLLQDRRYSSAVTMPQCILFFMSWLICCPKGIEYLS
eukprot:GFUD01107747.1.p1 GENE.GFUD01107747.1~~GFUD01107747.1.p1  ORF type:complete len:146 (+),score=21.98 GFUD01107747.1:97-534(+)